MVRARGGWMVRATFAAFFAALDFAARFALAESNDVVRYFAAQSSFSTVGKRRPQVRQRRTRRVLCARCRT